MKHILLKSILLALIGVSVSIQPALAAYIDPNTGGMAFQLLALIFSVLSGLVLLFSSRIRMAFFRLIRFVRGKKHTGEQSDD